jgi:hypothetical protein
MESHSLPNILQSGSKLQSVLLTTSDVLPSPMTWQPAMNWQPAEELTPKVRPFCFHHLIGLRNRFHFDISSPVAQSSNAAKMKITHYPYPIFKKES